MSSENKPEEQAQQAAPAPEAAKEQELKAHEVPEVLDFLRENGMSILVGVGLAVALYLGYSAFQNYKKSAVAAASDMLFRARSAEEIQQVITRYGSTPAAALAHLSLASAQFDAGQYELADHTFGEFQQAHPGHSLAAQAELGRAHCREALGQVNEALDAFNRFATGYPDHYLTPLAVFGKARCLEQLAKFPEAKVVYEDFIAGQPEESPWRSRAEAALLYLDKDARAAKNAPDAAAAPLQAPVVFNPAPTAPISDPESAPPAR